MLFGRKLRVISAVFAGAGVVLAAVAVLMAFAEGPSARAGSPELDDPIGSYLGAMIVGAVAALLLVLGVVLLLVGRAGVRQAEWLRENGREIWAEVTSVEPDTTATHGDRPSYFVHAIWRDLDGSTHTAKSARLPRNPALELHMQRRVRLFVHPRHPDITVVDIPGV